MHRVLSLAVIITLIEQPALLCGPHCCAATNACTSVNDLPATKEHGCGCGNSGDSGCCSQKVIHLATSPKTLHGCCDATPADTPKSSNPCSCLGCDCFRSSEQAPLYAPTPTPVLFDELPVVADLGQLFAADSARAAVARRDFSTVRAPPRSHAARQATLSVWLN